MHFENLYSQCKCQPIICEYTCSLKGSPELPECNGASATESARALSSEPLDPPPSVAFPAYSRTTRPTPTTRTTAAAFPM